jgi:hypothetical protein
VQAALLVSKCEPKSIPRVAEEMKVHGLLVCTYLFAQGVVDSCKDHNREEEKVCVCVCVREREREREREFQSSIVWTYQNPSSLI